MPGAVRASDALVAELLERLAAVSDPDEACSIVLDRAAGEGGIERAFLIIRKEHGLRGVGWGIPAGRLGEIVRAAEEGESQIYDTLADIDRLKVFETPLPPPIGWSGVAVPIAGIHGVPLGVAFLDTREIDGRADFAVELFRRCGPTLHRTLQVASLGVRVDRFSRQRDLLTDIVNAIGDPVILTNGAADIVLANRRAENLLTPGADDSEGRRRAVEVNNLLFSSFLTQAVISGGRSAAHRELNLVDTFDGSDLLFEVLSMPLAGMGDGSVISVLRDITDLKRAVSEMEVQFGRSRVAEHKARLERDRLNVILENVSDPILVTDDHSNIVLMNPEADRLFVASPETQGTKRHVIQSNDTRFTTLISNFLLWRDQRLVEKVTLTDPDDGREFPAEVLSSKILNARGEPTAIVSVVHDLTQAEENERLARELRQLNEGLEDRIRQATLELEERNRRLEWQSFELQKASRLKSEFLANMSHELRTPINVMLGYTSLMRERIYGQLTDQQEEALGKVYSTSQHLLDLINDILDLSKIEAGKMPLHIEAVDLSELLAELSQSIQPMVRNRDLVYETHIDDDLPRLHTDRTKLRQVLLNLMSNAIKFTHDGTVSVHAVNVPGERVRITVADSGIGIQPDHLEAIFEDFRQLDQSHTREYGGTGLGLSITRKLLSLLGGVIAVESTYGTGSKFIVELPADAPLAEPDNRDAFDGASSLSSPR